MKIHITSLLLPTYYGELEQLLFFNPQQGHWRRRIVWSVEQYGNPRLVERHGGLRIDLPGAPDNQTLYAVAETARREELAGLLCFNRNANEEFVVLHLAVKSEYTLGGGSDNRPVAYLLLRELQAVARRVKGVRAIRLPYGRGRLLVDAEWDCP